MLGEHVPDNLPGRWTLGNRLQLEIVRVVHQYPDDKFDGWRVSVLLASAPIVEVLHSHYRLARTIAVEEFARLFPEAFKGNNS